MQVPEKLSLIGGSILLASTLVFTLKSQASDILPKVDSGMSSLTKSDQERQQDQQKQQEQSFNSNFQQAQQKGWQTGNWGTAKFYVDNNENMHVGGGQLSGSFSKVVNTQQIKTINLDDEVQAPQDSGWLFANTEANDTSLNAINGLSNLDTSQVTNMTCMLERNPKITNLDISHFDTSKVTSVGMLFMGDDNLNNLDVSHFDTHNVTNMDSMFESNSSLSNLDLSHFDTHNVNDMDDMFANDDQLSNLDISRFDTHNVNDMGSMFYEDNIHQLSLGSNTQLQDSQSNGNYNSGLTGTYQSNGQTLNLDSNAHPGTWVKQ